MYRQTKHDIMKPLKDIRYKTDFIQQETSCWVKQLNRYNIDFDVYLPSIGMNLQRDFVWNIHQKRELINSILLERRIPHLAAINLLDDTWQIIDGKQRLSAALDFVNDKFTYVQGGNEYLFSEMPNEYKVAINNFSFRFYTIYENYDKKISDVEKINWFSFINFAGTPQDKDYMEELSKKMNL